jgi:predicted ATP-dependent endonuclease of OLD family
MHNEPSQIKIRSIFISNFRSFSTRSKKEGMNIDDLSAVNIFVGPNSSGKTNFFNAIRICNDWGPFNSMGTCFYEHNSHKSTGVPIEITVQLETSNGFREIKYIQQDNLSVESDYSLKERIYPIGLPHKFSEFNKIHEHEINNNISEQDRSYARICRNWETIREDANRVGLALPESLPQEPTVNPTPKDYADRFFYDLVDNYGVPILEGSDGMASFLLMIVKIRIRKPGSVILIEEPEVNMHPGLQKRFLDYLEYLAEKDNYQFLINTHSPYLMNLAVAEDADKVAVFRISKDATDSTQIKRVENKTAENWQILADLGHKPADVLQANGIIWVEGPSDLIYIDVWISKFAPELHRGKDYEIIWYGGSNFAQLAVEDEQRVREMFWQDGEISQKLISLFSINPNWAFIVDSDSDKESHANTKVQITYKTINGKKDDFIEECKTKGKYTWKVDPFIEECILGRGSRPRGKSKVEWAHEYKRDVMADNSSDGRLSPIAHNKVEELISVIRKWC